MSKIYVTTVHKWGSLRNHTYVVGAYRSAGRAHLQGEMERGNRGGLKYEYRVTVCPSGPARNDHHDFIRRGGRCDNAFMRKLAIQRAWNWYRNGDYKRWGGM